MHKTSSDPSCKQENSLSKIQIHSSCAHKNFKVVRVDHAKQQIKPVCSDLSLSLDDIIESVRADLEAPFISPETAALAVTAVATTTATKTTRRSTRAWRAPERFAPTPLTRLHHYEVATIHAYYQVGRVDYYLVSWVVC